MTINSINGANTQMGQMIMKQQKQSSFDDMIGGNQKTGAADTGVLISLSTAKEQIAGMKKVRTDLQGKLRVAQTDEEKAALQEKIDNITQNISDRVKETQDTISDYQKAEQDKKEDKKENEANAVSEEANGSVAVKSTESVDTNVELQTEKE